MRWLWALITLIIVAILFISFNNNNNQLGLINSDNLTRLTYAGILVSVIAAGIVSSNIPLSNIVKNAFIWLAIIAIIVSFYNNRYQFQDIAHNISGGLIPASVISIDLSNKNTVTIERANNGHYQINGLIDNQRVHFLVDTGASSIVLTHETALNLGMDIQNLHYTTLVSTANGELKTASIRLKTIEIGTITRKNLRALIAPSGALSDNLLGMNFINTLTSTSIRGSQLLLID